MDYKLRTNADGDVNFITKAGGDYVKGSMPIGKAQGICASSDVEVSEMFDGFPIAADGKFFEGKVKAENADEPKEDKPKQESYKKYDNDKKKN